MGSMSHGRLGKERAVESEYVGWLLKKHARAHFLPEGAQGQTCGLLRVCACVRPPAWAIIVCQSHKHGRS